MAQNFPLVTIDPSTKTGTLLAEDLENFSETMRSMMSGANRADEFLEGLWLRTNADGTADVVYSNTSHNADLALFTVASGTTGVSLTSSVSLGGTALATADTRGTVQLASNAEALAGTETAKVTAVRETKAMIDQAIGNLINGSVDTLDTLDEIAQALGNDPNFATTITNTLAKCLRVDGAQTFTADEQARGRNNLGLGGLASRNTVGRNEIDNSEVITEKIGNNQVTKAKLATDVFATAAEALSASPPANAALSPQAFFSADEIAVVDVPSNAPTTLAGNGYKRRFYVQSTGGVYAYVPPPVDAFVLQGTASGILNDLADVDAAAATTGAALVRDGSAWVARKPAFADVIDAEPRTYTSPIILYPGQGGNLSTITYYSFTYNQLTLVFSPSRIGAKILIDANISYEGGENNVWFMELEVDGSRGPITGLMALQDGKRNHGMSATPFDTTVSDTMNQTVLSGSIVAQSTMVHKVYFSTKNTNQNAVLSINKTYADQDGSGFERATSYARVMEWPWQ